ncbi:hemoglobin subunit alpha-like [Erpetoichthys calabaricus]|uniref:Hemoglobin, alpha adult 2 n=1 Tax=Erpetoichthys calabaricus TaxID=27687 RepID=A0A8C4T4Q2_ERPCA|nr:hemoglobin subunit alpha-like [Erpetoichthys calabaricus]
MSLSSADISHVKGIWSKAKGKGGDLGKEALQRMFCSSPQTKTYFAHWGENPQDSPNTAIHGKKIFDAINDAVDHISDIHGALSKLSDLHATKLKVDPANFKILSHNILVTLSRNFPSDFTPEVHLSFDKFLDQVALSLAEKYR